ncbi:MAG: ABC transporter permease subunit [Halobacteriovoraceae bacterium]|nr:ABC transporter permease subunit [Halobacteriovoraceae bacterium]MCB9095561.1 ABC transporter permease subunit [Halobacteriovoraceae bacterium]
MIAQVTKELMIKEIKSYFKTPLGYVFLVIFLFGIGYLTFEPGRGSFFYMREASMSAFFRYIPWMFLFLIPAVSMKLWAEERKSGSIELLLTMPITVRQAVVAKFLASWAFIGLALLGTTPMIFTVSYLGNPDFGVIILGYLASFLMAGALLAVGGFFSALTKNQVVSFILTVVACFILIMAGSPPILEFISALLPKYFVDLFESLSVLNHFDSIERGVFSLSNLWFFAVTIFFWLFGSIILLNENKAN